MTTRELQDEILRLKKENDLCILAHAYQSHEILEVADYTGDSYGLSVLQHLQFECPDKKFYPLSKDCVCHNMKLTTLMDVYNCVKGTGGEEITLDEDVRVKALKCINTMLTLGA